VESSHQIYDLVLLDGPQVAKERCGVGMPVLSGLELEDPIPGLELEVQSERAKQVLERLVDALIASQFPQAGLRGALVLLIGHKGEGRAYTIGGEGDLTGPPTGVFLPMGGELDAPLSGCPTPKGGESPPRRLARRTMALPRAPDPEDPSN
jgi:hypothetical protein